MNWRQDGFRSGIYFRRITLTSFDNIIFSKNFNIFNEFRYFLHLVENFLR